MSGETITVKDHDLAMQTTACPACKVRPGYPCWSKKRGRVHPSRIKAMRAGPRFVHPRLAKSAEDRKMAKAQRVKQKAQDRDFYSSWEWKKVRFEVLKVHGRRCQCCGWQPGDTVQGHLVVDHIQPRKKRPDLALELTNLQVLCNDCNMGKSNVHEDDFREFSHRSFDQAHKATIQ